MIRHNDDIERGTWFDWWYGSKLEWRKWHDRHEPMRLPGEKRRGIVYCFTLTVFLLGLAIGLFL